MLHGSHCASCWFCQKDVQKRYETIRLSIWQFFCLLSLFKVLIFSWCDRQKRFKAKVCSILDKWIMGPTSSLLSVSFWYQRKFWFFGWTSYRAPKARIFLAWNNFQGFAGLLLLSTCDKFGLYFLWCYVEPHYWLFFQRN